MSYQAEHPTDDELAAMSRLQEKVLNACKDPTIHMGQQINAIASALGHLVALAYLGFDDADAPKFEEFRGEAVKRLLDAGFSMQDYMERKTPWRAQSSTMKRDTVSRVKAMRAS